MKGVSFITDETKQKRFVQIDMDKLESLGNAWEDLYDLLIAESRKGGDKISSKDFKNQLRKAGKL